MVGEERGTLVNLKDTDLTVRDEQEDVRGRDVIDQHGDEIGEVEDLLIDEQDVKVRYLQLGAGGFLGIGEKKFLIPVDAVTNVTDKQVQVDRSRDEVIGGPEYDPEMALDESYYTGLYGYYGYTPYWGPGYAYPPFPYYR